MLPSSRVKSCDYCRQHRLRCDRPRREPESCTECENRHVSCNFSATSIQRQLRKPDGRRPNGKYKQATPKWPVYQRAKSPMAASQSSHAESFRLCPFDGPSQQIDDVRVTPSQINEYFAYFFNAMHPHFPFLTKKDFSIAYTLESSPLLFWTIMTISSGVKNRALYRDLQHIVRRLVADVLYPSGHGLQTCQAICLLCLWPFDSENPNDDPSFLFAGIVTHLALRLGLHRPEFQHEFKKITDASAPSHPPTTLHEMWSTWCACKFVEHQLATKLGVPSGTQDDWPLRMKMKSSHPSGAPAVAPQIKNQLLLCSIRDQYLSTVAYEGHSISGMVTPIERLGRLRLFSAALEDFEATNTPLDTCSAIFLRMTRITLAGFYLARDLIDCNFQDCHTQLLIGMEAALSLLDLIVPLAWETLPVHALRAVLYAGVFAAHLRRMNIQLLPSMDPVGILQRATDIMRHLAYGNDFPTRAKIVLEAELERDTASSTSKNGMQAASAGVTFQARMGANMYWDLVESKKEKHNWSQSAEDIYSELLLSGVFPPGNL